MILKTKSLHHTPRAWSTATMTLGRTHAEICDFVASSCPAYAQYAESVDNFEYDAGQNTCRNWWFLCLRKHAETDDFWASSCRAYESYIKSVGIVCYDAQIYTTSLDQWLQCCRIWRHLAPGRGLLRCIYTTVTNMSKIQKKLWWMLWLYVSIISTIKPNLVFNSTWLM